MFQQVPGPEAVSALTASQSVVPAIDHMIAKLAARAIVVYMDKKLEMSEAVAYTVSFLPRNFRRHYAIKVLPIAVSEVYGQRELSSNWYRFIYEHMLYMGFRRGPSWYAYSLKK